MSEKVNHPAHYGGESNPYEAIKIIEALGFGFCLGNCIKYIWRAGRKPGASAVEDLEKAVWYLSRELANRKLQENKQASEAVESPNQAISHRDKIEKKQQLLDALHATSLGDDEIDSLLDIVNDVLGV